MDMRDDDTARYLKREFKPRAPRRCTSLPEWRIVPGHRPLFACQTCGFVNLFGELCLWCKGGCALVSCSAKAPVRRRVSAPHLLNDTQKEQLRLVQRCVVLRVRHRASGLTAAWKPKVALRAQSSCDQAERPSERRRRHRDAALYSVDKAFPSTLLATQTETAGDYTETTFVVPESCVPSSPQEPEAPQFSPEKARPIADERNDEKPRPTLEPSPYRTLRRRRRFSLTNKISSRSLRARIARPMGGDTSAEIHVSKIDADDRASASTPPSAPSIVLSVPLGTPGRPLYTAIRRNMFPASPSAASTRFPPVRGVSIHEGGLVHVPSAAERAEGEWVYIPSFYPGADGYGFSISGETELRMALARQDRWETRSTQGAEEFRFQETKHPRSSANKVRSLGKNIKHFFTGRRK